MDPGESGPQRLLGAVSLVTLPSAAVLLALAALGRVELLDAGLGWLCIAALTALSLWPRLADLDAVGRWVRALGEGPDAEPPRLRRAWPAEDLASAIAHLRRLWRQRQGELTAAASWHETVFDALPDPLVLLDDGRRVVRLNQAARKTLGRQATGRDLAAALRNPEVLEAVDAVLAGAGGTEAEFILPVPVERSFIARVERLGQGGADGTAAILALHDITTVRRLEQMRADFVANASHELRTPLSALLGFIETLQGPARDDAEARERFLAIMREQASRMARLVADLLSLSRIELNEHSAPSATVDLRRIVESAAEAMQPLAKARGMTLAATIDPRVGAIAGQEDELAQLLQNLLDNAVKYGREGTTIDIALTLADNLPPAAAHLRPGQTVTLAVSDCGEGIAREHLPRLTERFYRVDTARSRKLGGTGLGLAIVKHIVNRHRGLLVIDSVPGRGSTFAVHLPLQTDTIPVAPPPPAR